MWVVFNRLVASLADDARDRADRESRCDHDDELVEDGHSLFRSLATRNLRAVRRQFRSELARDAKLLLVAVVLAEEHAADAREHVIEALAHADAIAEEAAVALDGLVRDERGRSADEAIGAAVRLQVFA